MTNSLCRHRFQHCSLFKVYLIYTTFLEFYSSIQVTGCHFIDMFLLFFDADRYHRTLSLLNIFSVTTANHLNPGLKPALKIVCTRCT
jgi:hypothetical protein